MIAFLRLHLSCSQKPPKRSKHYSELSALIASWLMLNAKRQSAFPTHHAAIINPLHPYIATNPRHVGPTRSLLIKSSPAPWEKLSSWPIPKINPNVTHPRCHSKGTWVCAHAQRVDPPLIPARIFTTGRASALESPPAVQGSHQVVTRQKGQNHKDSVIRLLLHISLIAISELTQEVCSSDVWTNKKTFKVAWYK